MTGLGSIGLIVFAIYMALLVAIGLIAARFQRTSEDFWVAGRRFGIGLMVVAEMASVLHGGSVQGGVALAARFGGVAILPYISFAIASLIIVRFFAKKLRMMSGFTLPDYMGARFESNFLRGYSALIIFISSVLYMIAQIRVMGFLLERLLGIPFVAGMALGTGIFILFVTLGGLLAVVWTDILLFVLMWTGLIALMPAVTAAAGGLTHVLIAADRVAPGWTSVRGTTWSWTYLVSWWLVWVVGYATRVTMITKVFAAKDTRVARISLPITDALFMIFLLYGNLYLGAAARVLVWNQIAKAPDQAFPALVTYVSNLAGTPWLGALAITGVVSAAIATSDSLLLMSGAAVAHDFLRKCYFEPRGVVEDGAVLSRYIARGGGDRRHAVISRGIADARSHPEYRVLRRRAGGGGVFLPDALRAQLALSIEAGGHVVIGGRFGRRNDLDDSSPRRHSLGAAARTLDARHSPGRSGPGRGNRSGHRALVEANRNVRADDADIFP